MSHVATDSLLTITIRLRWLAPMRNGFLARSACALCTFIMLHGWGSGDAGPVTCIPLCVSKPEQGQARSLERDNRVWGRPVKPRALQPAGREGPGGLRGLCEPALCPGPWPWHVPSPPSLLPDARMWNQSDGDP